MKFLSIIFKNVSKYIDPKVFGILIILLLLWGYLAYAVPESFLKANNLENIIRRSSLYAILGIGVAFVIMTSGIDLSVGSILCLCGCALAIFLNVNYEPLGEQKIWKISAPDNLIILQDETDQFSEGDLVSLYETKAAKKGIYRIKSVTTDEFEGDQVTFLTIDTETDTGNKNLQPNARGRKVEEVESDEIYRRMSLFGKLGKFFSKPSPSPKIAPVVEVASFRKVDFNDETAVELTLKSNDERITTRDQVSFVNPKSGLKNEAILDVKPGKETDSTVIVTRDLGSKFDLSWLAVPKDRHQNMGVLPAIFSVLALGAFLGLIHGLLVTVVNLRPFVVTLCGLLIYRGLIRWYTMDASTGLGTEYDTFFRPVAREKFYLFEIGGEGFGIPYPFFIMIGIAILAAIFLNKTIWGRYILALGRNEEAARFSGINTRRLVIATYVICAALAGVGGILFMLENAAFSPAIFGSYYELYAIAAAVLGGCSLRGGEGSIFGVIIGAALIQSIRNATNLLDITDRLEFAIIGGVILAAVILDEILQRISSARRAKKSAKIAEQLASQENA